MSEDCKKVKIAKKIERELSKAAKQKRTEASASECLKYVTIIFDKEFETDKRLCEIYHNVSMNELFKTKIDFSPHPFAVSWIRAETDFDVDEEQGEVILSSHQSIVKINTVFLLMEDLVLSISKGEISTLGAKLKNVFSKDHRVIIVVLGCEAYFKRRKNAENRKHRTAVLEQMNTSPTVGKKPARAAKAPNITRAKLEEACIELQIHHSIDVVFSETPADAADYLQTATKSIAESRRKATRLQSAFQFLPEKRSGVVKVRDESDLASVWKQQLMMLKSVSADIAAVVVEKYPSLACLRDAYAQCDNDSNRMKLLENLAVTRDIVGLETSRRVGPELSRRIFQYLTVDDPEFVIK